MWLKCFTLYISKYRKLSGVHKTRKGQFSFQSQRRAMPKNVQTTVKLHVFPMLAKVKMKFAQSCPILCNPIDYTVRVILQARMLEWALGSITINKASGGNGIPVELFQILKVDAVKVLHSMCQQIWKTQQWPQDWKRSVFIPIPKKGNAKECSNYHTIALISHASKVMLKSLQARLQQYVNHELPDVQAGFRKGRGTRD